MLGLEHAAALTYEALGGQTCEPTRLFNLLSRRRRASPNCGRATRG